MVLRFLKNAISFKKRKKKVLKSIYSLYAESLQVIHWTTYNNLWEGKQRKLFVVFGAFYPQGVPCAPA